MTALIPRVRRWERFWRDEYALSPATASGRVRGRPTGPGTRILFRTGMNCGLSPACPAVIFSERGRHCGTQDRGGFVVSPPRERPQAGGGGGGGPPRPPPTRRCAPS